MARIVILGRWKVLSHGGLLLSDWTVLVGDEDGFEVEDLLAKRIDLCVEGIIFAAEDFHLCL